MPFLSGILNALTAWNQRKGFKRASRFNLSNEKSRQNAVVMALSFQT